MSCTRLLFTSQLLYNIKKTNINIWNLTFIMRKKAIRITRFLRKSIADTFLETRPAWISFSQGSFCFFKFFSSSIGYRTTCDLLFFSYGGVLEIKSKRPNFAKIHKNMIYIKWENHPESIGTSFVKISWLEPEKLQL